MDRISQIDSPDEFTRLCKALLSAEYHDFQTIDDSGGDGGNDGYSESKKTLFQLYCPKKPEKANDASYQSKITEDLDKAKKLVESGKYEISEWIFITPRELREPVQTFLREEAIKRGFVGIAWASPKLGELLAKHKHLRSQFPNLIQPDIEEQIQTKVVDRLDSVEDVKKTYRTKTEQNYQRKIDAAKEKLDQGKHTSAKKDYEAILSDLLLETEEIDPHIYFRVYNNLGVCEMNLNNHTRAAELYEKAYEAEPELPMAIAKLALSKIFKDVPEEGLPIIDKLLNEHPDDDHFISVKGNILFAQKNYDELLPFLRSKGKMVLFHWYDGFRKMDAQDFDGAIASFESVAKLEPENTRALQLIAQNVMVGMKTVVRDNPFPPDKIPPEIKDKFLRAIECLKEAIRLLKKSEHQEDLEMAYANLSGCYTAVGDYKAAIEASGEATVLDPKSAVPFLNKGIAQLKLGNYKDAIQSFQTFKELGGQDFDVDRHIAFCSLRSGDLETAERIIEETLESASGLDLDVAELAIDLYSRRLDNEKLEPILKRLEQEYSDNPQALRVRSLYLQRRGLEGAKALIQKAIQNAQNQSEKVLAELDLADFYYDQKEYEDAGEIYKKYINIQDGTQATYRYAECLYNSGRYGELLNFIDTLGSSVRENHLIKQLEAYSNLYLGNLEKASQMFKELYEKNPGSLQYLVFYGMCRFRLGKIDDTKNAYDAIKNKVTETQDLITLAGGYEFIGDWESAINLTYKALKGDDNDPKAHLAFIFAFLRREQAEGVEPEEEHIKAFQKSIGEFNKRFPEEKALQGFEVKDNDVSEILKMVDKMTEVTDNATGLYRDSKAPMAFIPRMTGKHPFDVWAAFTQMPDVGIRMSFGSADEMAAEREAIEQHRSGSVVVDIYPLFILAHLGHLDILTKLFKKVYVHQSVMDELTEVIDDRKVSLRKGVTVMGKRGDQHTLDEITSEQVKKALTLLEKVRDFIRDNDQVDIKGFSKEHPEDERDIINALHKSTRDGVLLAQELKVAFYCDDRILRAILLREENMQSFSTQMLLIEALKEKIISLDEKFESQKTMVDMHYSYISIDATFVSTQLKKVDYRAEEIDSIATSLTNKDTNIQSLGVVLADLFLMIMTDRSVDSVTKLRAFTYILRKAMPNHDLEKIEEGMFMNLQRRISPERHAELRDMIRLVFVNAVQNSK